MFEATCVKSSFLFDRLLTNTKTTVTPTTATTRSVIWVLAGGNYDQRMDYNFNYHVDICDLTTVTANINM